VTRENQGHHQGKGRVNEWMGSPTRSAPGFRPEEGEGRVIRYQGMEGCQKEGRERDSTTTKEGKERFFFLGKLGGPKSAQKAGSFERNRQSGEGPSNPVAGPTNGGDQNDQ